MEEQVKIVQQYYDEDVEAEWERLAKHPFEFELTTRMMNRYIRPGDRVLDIGGGPGRYSLYFARRGCDVTLLDLSGENVAFAKVRAVQEGLPLNAYQCDAREASRAVEDLFDHVFLMGPMYHLLEEADRVRTMEQALSLLKAGGMLYVSFILLFSGVIYAMKYLPEMLLDQAEHPFLADVVRDSSYRGPAFTQAHFISQREILPFLSRFPLEKLHLFGQEGILSPCEETLLAQPEEVQSAWLSLAERLCEREELLSYSEHAMYIGRKHGR